MRWSLLVPILLGLAWAQSLALVPTSGETRMAALQEILTGRGSWGFTLDLRYDATGLSSTYRVLLELVPAGPAGVSLAAYVTPGTPRLLAGSGSPGTLRTTGRTLWGAGFRELLGDVGPVRGQLPLTLELSALAPGPLLPGYYFLQVTALILPQ